MSRVWADFYDYILPEVGGAATALVDLVLRNTVIDFYEFTAIDTRDITPIDLVADTATYTPTPPTGYDISRFEVLYYVGNKLFPAGGDQLQKIYTDWTTMTGAPRFYMSPQQDTLRFVPIPTTNETAAVTGRMVLKPTRSATGVEDWIFNRWVDTMALGTKAKLMMMPAKSWTNPELGVTYMKQFKAEQADARADAYKSFTRAQLQVAFRSP